MRKRVNANPQLKVPPLPDGQVVGGRMFYWKTWMTGERAAEWRVGN